MTLQVIELQLADNLLTGPAFPPTWLLPGALASLEQLDVANSRGLVGTLPPDLPWPALKIL